MPIKGKGFAEIHSAAPPGWSVHETSQKFRFQQGMPTKRKLPWGFTRSTSRAKRRLAFPVAPSARGFGALAKRRQLNNAVKRIIGRYVETKSTIIQAEDVQLWHSCGITTLVPWSQTVNNLLATSQGTNQTTRVGDKIQSRYLHFRLWLSNKLDRPNVMYRILVVSGENNDFVFGTNIARTGASSNIMLADVDTDKYRVHYDKILQPVVGYKASVSGGNIWADKEESRFHEFRVNTSKMITYKTDNGTVPNGANTYVLYVIPYDAKGTQETDNIASYAYQIVHYFRDM